MNFIMENKQFKAESKRLLDLMINSIYTNKEIFLRELISNASDAIDKLYYRSLTDKNVKVNKDDLYIRITPNKEARTLTIEDNGCGMNKEELEENLGTIAKSGSLAFKKLNEKKDDVDIIGQFGVGFYSGIYVAEEAGLFFCQAFVYSFVVRAPQSTHVSGNGIPGTSLVAQMAFKLFQSGTVHLVEPDDIGLTEEPEGIQCTLVNVGGAEAFFFF